MVMFLKAKKIVGLLCCLALVHIFALDISAAVESVSGSSSGIHNDGEGHQDSPLLGTEGERVGGVEAQEEEASSGDEQAPDEVDQGDSEGEGAGGREGYAPRRRLATEERLARLLRQASRRLEESIAHEDTHRPRVEAPGELDAERAALERTREAANMVVDAASYFFASLGELMVRKAARPLTTIYGMADTVKAKVAGGKQKIGEMKDEASNVVGRLTETVSSALLHLAETNPELFSKAVELQDQLLAVAGSASGYARQVKDAADAAVETMRQASEV